MPGSDGVCRFKGCRKPQFRKGLCSGHNSQRGRGQELTPLRAKRPKGTTEGKCPCGRPVRQEGQWYCGECSKWRQIKSKFSIDRVQYLALLDSQGGNCALCNRPAESFSRRLAVDHDHRCCPSKDKSCGKCIRGLLCTNCNSGIGKLGDDPELLAKAADYVRRGGVQHGNG